MRRLREARAFWLEFEQRWGRPPGDPPHLYWTPALGHFGLRPCDLADVTPQQMTACLDALAGS